MTDQTLEVSEERFAEEAEGFLAENATLKPESKTGFGEGSDEIYVLPERTPEQDAGDVAAAKAWAQKVFDAGFGWITGPKAYGGRALPKSYQGIYSAIESRYTTAGQGPRGIGLGMIAPTILAHGTETAKQRYLRALYRGDIIACQLFSEPGAGSDLASLQTRAVLDGDEWLVNGQKGGTSGAHYSDIGEIICRTDPDLPKHKGLTGFIVDMHAKGVDIRPLRQMTGGASFNEVFFTDVRIPADHLLGDVNSGWTVALTTLMNERASIGGGGGGAPSGCGDLSPSRVTSAWRTIRSSARTSPTPGSTFRSPDTTTSGRCRRSVPANSPALSCRSQSCRSPRTSGAQPSSQLTSSGHA